MHIHRAEALLIVCVLVGCGSPSEASTTTAPRVTAGDATITLIDAPPPPEAPATIARDAQHRATIRAVRISTPIKIDGRLDEPVYTTTTAAGGWIQQTPDPGEPATEPTDFWILFDDDNLYISMMLHETHPERRVGSERRRDAASLNNDDNVMLVIDTFYDRRNAFNFQVNSVGGFRDQSITDANVNAAWNTIWDVKVADAEDGYAFEMAIPFKSLRYGGSGPQVWGFNARRTTKWKNEISFLNPVPIAYGGQGINRLSTAASLVGIETPPRTLNLEVKPYAISTVTTDRTTAVPYSNRGAADAGLDFKYGLTRSLTADVTVNTDFAQVEEDVQQVNLTRFSLLFPEKRDFFLEGAGQFEFGVLGAGGAGNQQFQLNPSSAPVLFFSRRIGLNDGQEVPVRVGARATGRLAGYEVGLLNVQTGETADARAQRTNFTAVRVRRNILSRSNIGMITTLRRPAIAGNQNAAYGVDANLRFYENLESSMYIAGTSTQGAAGGDDLSYRTYLVYGPDSWGFSLEHLKVGKTFDPQVGFLRRSDFRTSTATLRYSPRPKHHPFIRQLRWNGNFDYTTNAAATRLENRSLRAMFTAELHNSDTLNVFYDRDYEYLPSDFRIATGVVVPRGAYNYGTVSGWYQLGTQRKVSGFVSASRSTLYGGTRTGSLFQGRVRLSPTFVLEPGITFNRVKTPYGNFDADLLNTRFVIMPSPRVQISSLVQFNPSGRTFTGSVRLRWEYTPGSDLFVVYSDGRDTDDLTPATLLNRTFAIKATRLFRF